MTCKRARKFQAIWDENLEVLNNRVQAVYALCNENIIDLILIVEHHSMKHTVVLCKLSIEEKSEDTKRCVLK
jgi:hypothetical protein